MPSSACAADTPDLHSFPTRRSSDLRGGDGASGMACRVRPDALRGCVGVPARPRRRAAGGSDRGRRPAGRASPRHHHRTRRPGGEHPRSEEHTSELQSLTNLVCRLLLVPPTPQIYTLSLHDALPISEAAMARAAWLVECGRMRYADASVFQRALVAARQAGRIEDVVLLVEHPPVITIGRGGRAANILVSRDLLAAQGFDVHATERGGDVTYHGPGQLVGYPILDLGALDEDVVRYVRGLEAALIGALERFGIAGARLRGYPGVWVGDAKVA